MRTKLISSNQEYHPGCGIPELGSGDKERYIFECPCGKGTITESHDNIPGFSDHIVWLNCDECKKKYKLDTSNGVRRWELIEKTEEN